MFLGAVSGCTSLAGLSPGSSLDGGDAAVTQASGSVSDGASDVNSNAKGSDAGPDADATTTTTFDAAAETGADAGGSDANVDAGDSAAGPDYEDITSSSNHTTFDLTNVSANVDGYEGAVFDGRYIYLVPGQHPDGGNPNQHAASVRHREPASAPRRRGPRWISSIA